VRCVSTPSIERYVRARSPYLDRVDKVKIVAPPNPIGIVGIYSSPTILSI
jgi:hypothetical protein